MTRQTSTTRRYGAIAGLALAILTILFAPTQRAWSDDVDKLFDQGNAALKKGDFKTAHEKLSKAWQIRQSFDIAANLSQAEQRLGKTREAAEHLAYALAHFPASEDAKVKGAMAAALTDLKKGLAELKVSTDAGATITVDGKTVGLSPLTLPVYVDPGEHTFAAEKGSAKGSVTLTFRAGESDTVQIKLKDAWALPSASVSASASATPTASTAPSSNPPDHGPPKWPGFLVGGVGLVGVAIGGGLLGAGAGARTDAEDTANGVGPCDRSAPSDDCQALFDDFASADTLSNAGLGTIIAGGAVLATGVGLLIWSYTAEGDAPDEKPMAILPLLGPEQAGVQFRATF